MSDKYVEYKVTWEIQLNAKSPREAAAEALKMQRDVFSEATVFEVEDPDGNTTTVDMESCDN